MKPIAATLSNFRPVSTRKVVQLILEIPIERATEALMALGGVPDPSNPQWVGIVALNEEPVEEDAIKLFPRIDRSGPLEPLPSQVNATGTLQKKRRKFDELPFPQQAAIRIRSEAFRRFLAERCGAIDIDEPSANHLVRNLCGVTSKADIKLGSSAAIAWLNLDAQFRDWIQEPVI
jgi:hypothetical protein